MKLLLALVLTFSIFGGSAAGIEGPVGENHTTVELLDQRPPL